MALSLLRERVCQYGFINLNKRKSVLTWFIISSGSRIWSRGGPRIFFRDFADIAKRSWAIKVNNIIFQYTRIWEFLQICSFFFSLQVH